MFQALNFKLEIYLERGAPCPYDAGQKRNETQRARPEEIR
jgi:hypothetical protein